MKGQFLSVLMMTIMMGPFVGPATSQVFAYKEGVKVSNQERTFFCNGYDSLMAVGYYLRLGKPREAERVEGCEQVESGTIGISRDVRGLALRIDMTGPAGKRDGWVFLGKFLSLPDWKYRECSQDPHAMGKTLFDCSDFADKDSWKN